MPGLDEALTALIPPTLLLNNLFQLTPTTWRANLTDGELCWEFGEAASPSAAILAAVAKLQKPAVKTRTSSSSTPLRAEDILDEL